MTTVVVPRRFNGPPSSGNGGWSAGALAAHLAGPGGPAVTVQLRQPPPLETPMPLSEDDGWLVAVHGDAPALRARVADAAPEPVAPVTAAEARAAEPGYAGHRSHPFPGCVVCGTDRADGLRIFPGPVSADAAGRDRAAGTWTPAATEAVDVALTWAALDCTGAWAGDLEERLMVLGTMTAQVRALPEPGAEHVVVGLGRGQEGRKTYSSATLYSAAGDVLATAEHVWIAVDPRDFA